jgi:hypothetical protein
MKTEKLAVEKYDWNKDGAVNHSDVDFFIHEMPPGESDIRDLLKFQRDGGQLTSDDLIEFRKGGGEITANNLRTFTKRGGQLAAEDLFALMSSGVVISGDNLVSLSKRGVEITTADLKRFQGEFHGELSEKNIRYFENQGIVVDEPGTIPENATWSDIEGMILTDTKVDARDIMEWAGKHPEEASKMMMSFLKDKGIGEHNKGEVVAWLVEKGAKITKTDVYALQEQYHCFSGKELVDISSNGKIRFKAEDLIHLKTHLQCDFESGDLSQLKALDYLKMTPDQYKTLIG